MKKILSGREKIILYTTIGVIIFGVGFNSLVAPILDKNDMLNREIVLSRAKLKKYLILLGQKESLQNKYAQAASQVKQAEGEVLISGLSEMEDIAKGSGILITDIRPQSGAKKDSLYKESVIDVRAEGTIEGYLKFIYDIENSLTLLRIKKFQLTAKPNSQNLEGFFSISQIHLE